MATAKQAAGLNQGQPEIKHWILLAILASIWGSSFILMKKGLEAFSFDQVAALRIFLTFLAIIPIFLMRFREFQRKHLWPTLFVGVIGSAIPAFLFTLAETRIDSAVAGILNSFTPLCTLLVGVLFFGAVFKLQKLFGILIGLLGAAALIYFSTPPDLDGGYLYGLLIVLASICYASSINVIKTYLQDMNPILLTAVTFGILGPFFGLYLSTTDVWFIISEHELGLQALGYVSILAVLGTALASVLFFYITQETNPVFASTVTYLQPIVALFWGVIAGEYIGWPHALGLGMILGGVYLVSLVKN